MPLQRDVEDFHSGGVHRHLKEPLGWIEWQGMDGEYALAPGRGGGCRPGICVDLNAQHCQLLPFTSDLPLEPSLAHRSD